MLDLSANNQLLAHNMVAIIVSVMSILEPLVTLFVVLGLRSDFSEKVRIWTFPQNELEFDLV